MADQEKEQTHEGKTHEEWLAAERARLEKGFTFEPKPPSAPSKPGTADEVLAGLGLGAGVAAGAAAPHSNPTTFEGVQPALIANALRNEIPDDDTRVEVDRAGDSLVVTVLQSRENAPHQFLPALTVTMIEAAGMLTVTVSDLTEGTVRTTLGSIGGTVLEQGKRVVLQRRRRGVAGLLDAAGHVMEGVQDLVEDIQDLALPRRVWTVIDRVGGAAEEAALKERREKQKLQWKREAAERAWTRCEWCDRVYKDDEADRTDCPACGAPRGDKPALLS
jgi:hypothetical protein